MLITRAPVRTNLAGSVVVSTTVDKYFYVFLSVRGDDGLQIASSDYRTFYRYDHGDLPRQDNDLALPRVVLDHFDVTCGPSVLLASEISPGPRMGDLVGRRADDHGGTLCRERGAGACAPVSMPPGAAMAIRLRGE